MSSLKIIREKMGISQEEAAGWLGISRSLVEHYERGSRSLPTYALLQLSKLEIMIVEFEKLNGSWNSGRGNEKNAAEESAIELQVPLHPRIAFQQDKKATLQRQLALLESGHIALLRQTLLIKYLYDNYNEQATTKQQLWLQMIYDAVCYKITKFDESKQLRLKLKILRQE